MRKCGLAVAMVAAAIALSGAFATSAWGAPGDIAFVDCVADGGLNGCADPFQDPLNGAESVAVSPDGTSAYVVSSDDDALSHFTRTPSGATTFAGCVANFGAHGCIDPFQDPMAEAEGVAVSPDGTSVYVVSDIGDSVSHFTRAANGDIAFAGCVADAGVHGCSNPADDALDGATAVAVSPDGNNVYVVANDADAISWYTRLPGGSITYVDCIADGGANGCIDPFQDPLANAQGIAISPDGTSVYVAADDDGAVSHFIRAANGNLTFAGCVAEPNPGAVGCIDPPIDSLEGASGVAVSPDGSSVYVASDDDASFTHLTRAPGGAITFAGCTADGGKSGCADPFQDPLDGAESVAVSSDGRSAYVVSATDDSIAHFALGAGGVPSFAGCIANPSPGAVGCIDPPKDALDTAIGVAVSPSGNSVYVASQSDASLSQFSRELAPPPTPADTTPPETTKGKGPKKTVKSKKAKAKITFAFSSEPGARFECALDKASFSACTSPSTVKVKAKRKAKPHTFAVAAIDAAGNRDSSPAEFAFKVKRKR